jgi:phage gpG-like protein
VAEPQHKYTQMANIEVKNIVKNLDGLKHYLQNRVKTIMGVEAVNFYKEGFLKGGSTTTGFSPWKKAKRLNPQSKWYGFQYGSTVAPPSNHPRRKGVVGKYKKRKASSITNYSPAATKRRTLSGETKELMNSIEFVKTPNGVRIFSDKPYADIINKGGQIKVFGKKLTTMPARPFIYHSSKLNALIRQKINKDIKNFK